MPNFKSQGFKIKDFVSLFLLFHTSLNFAAVTGKNPRNHQVILTSKCLCKNKQTKSRERWRISLFFLKLATWNLTVVKHCFILWNLQIIHITHTFWFYRRLKRVGSVLSRSELDPFLYIWYHTVRTLNGLSSYASNQNLP